MKRVFTFIKVFVVLFLLFLSIISNANPEKNNYITGSYYSVKTNAVYIFGKNYQIGYFLKNGKIDLHKLEWLSDDCYKLTVIGDAKIVSTFYITDKNETAFFYSSISKKKRHTEGMLRLNYKSEVYNDAVISKMKELNMDMKYLKVYDLYNDNNDITEKTKQEYEIEIERKRKLKEQKKQFEEQLKSYKTGTFEDMFNGGGKYIFIRDLNYQICYSLKDKKIIYHNYVNWPSNNCYKIPVGSCSIDKLQKDGYLCKIKSPKGENFSALMQFNKNKEIYNKQVIDYMKNLNMDMSCLKVYDSDYNDITPQVKAKYDEEQRLIEQEKKEKERLEKIRKAEEFEKIIQIRIEKIKKLSEGDVICYSQDWSYKKDVYSGGWFFSTSSYTATLRYQMRAVLIVEKIMPNGKIKLIVNNIESTDDEHYQSIKIGKLKLNQGNSVYLKKLDLFDDLGFQFCD